MSEESIYLVELQDSTGEIHGFCTGTGYMSLPFDYGQLNAVPPVAVSNVFYDPRVEQPGLFRQNMFNVGTTSGHSSGGYGEIILLNTDGGLDGFIDLGFDGQACVVKEGQPGMALSQFRTVITGTVEQCEVSWTRVTLRLKDKTSLLDTPAQSTLYLGNNAGAEGIEGGAELKDKKKPRLFGVCNNITPICVNTSKLIYQVDFGAVHSIVAVHDGGNVGQILQGPDYATSALLLAAYGAYDPASPRQATSTYSTCLAEGLFRLDQPAFLQITCDVVKGATDADNYASSIIGILAAEKAGSSSIVVQSLIDLAKAAPYQVGYYTGGNDVTTSAILDELCASVGAWWGFDNLGMFWCKQLQAPVASQAVMTLTPDEILSVERTATADGDKGVPVWRVNVDFSRNWTVQTSGLAGSSSGNQLSFAPDDASQLTQDRKNLLAMEYLRTKAEDASVKTLHPLAAEITIKTTLNSLADANALAAQALALRKVRRDRLTVKLSAQAVQYPIGGYWDNEAISELPYNYSSGASVRYGNYIYITGGISYNGAVPTVMSYIYRLNLDYPTQGWEFVTNLPANRCGHTAARNGSKLYMAGGFTDYFASTHPTSLHSSVISIDLANIAGGWTTLPVMPTPAANLGSCIYGGYLYLFGGINNVSGYLDDSATTSKAIRLNLATPTAWDDAGVTDIITPGKFPRSIVYGSYLYLFGYMGAVASRLNLASPASAWQTVTIGNLPSLDLYTAVALNNNILVSVAGAGSGISQPAGYTLNMDSMPTGAVWNDAAITNGPTAQMYLPFATYYKNSLYVIGSAAISASASTYRLRTNDNSADIAHLTSLGRTVMVKVPRYGYAAGRPTRIIGPESDLKNRIITLDLWG